MFDVVGSGLNAVDYLVGLPRFPVMGEKLRISAFAREGGGQVATALVPLSRWGQRCKYVGNVETGCDPDDRGNPPPHSPRGMKTFLDFHHRYPNRNRRRS